MPIRRMVFVAVLGVLPGALPARPAAAQLASPPATLESYWSEMRLDDVPSRASADGLGARVGWAFADAANPIVARSELTLHGTYAPVRPLEGSLRLGAATVGVGVDTRLLRRPLFGRVDPLASVGAGILRTRVTRVGPNTPAPLLERTETALTLTPGLGALLHLDRRLSLRATASYGHRHLARAVGMRFSL